MAITGQDRVSGFGFRVWERLAAYGRFVRLTHTLFSLPLLFAGAILGAGGRPSIRTLVLALAAGAGARIAALALNRIVDRRLDAANPRTADRELPAGRMSVAEAWGVAGCGSVVFLVAAALLPPPCLALAPIPLAVFALYPLLKRWTSLCHLGVGAALALAPLGGYLAAAGPIPLAPGIAPLAVFTFLWVAGFDVIYATLDAGHDRATGVRSLPARWGIDGALRAAAAAHGIAFGALVVMAGQRGALASPAALALLAFIGVLFVIEHLRSSSDVEFAFYRVNVVAGAAVLALAAAVV